jgi:uncharacterized protein
MSIKMQERYRSNEFDRAGVHTIHLSGLEVEINIPAQANFNSIALLGHPHSLQGGTMHNKVVTTLARVFSDQNIPSIRFNFRGVGLSEGTYDAGVGESEDLIMLANWWLSSRPNTKIFLAGFSFGSYVTYRAVLKLNPVMLISISPPVHHYDYNEFLPLPCPWLIVQGDADDVVPIQEVVDFIEKHAPEAKLECFADAGHFFHGRLVELKERVLANIMDLKQ